MGLCVIFLNIFVLKCIGLRASESDVTFTFIRHNAVADTILGLLTLYQTVYNLHKYDVLRECLLRYGMICGTTLASLLTIFGLNMDRFIKVVLPLRYDRIVSPLVVRVYLVFVWSVAVAGYIAPQLKVLSQNLVPKDCNFFVVLGSDYTCVVGTVILTVVGGQLYMYLHIFSVAVSKIVKDRQVVFDVSNGGQGRTFHDWWKPIRVVLLIVGLNACSVTPVGKYANIVVFMFGHLFAYSSVCLSICLFVLHNPFIRNNFIWTKRTKIVASILHVLSAWL